jgi:Ca-activated chloride channel family protein
MDARATTAIWNGNMSSTFRYRISRGAGRRARRGAILVLLALLLPVALVLCGFALNLAYLEMNRTELQIATDAAARSGGRALSVTGSTATAISTAESFAQLNPVAGQPLHLKPTDIVFGQANRPSLASRYIFTAGGNGYNALQVTGQRNATSIDGSLNVLLPGLTSTTQFGTTQMAQATEQCMDIVLVVDRSGSMAYSVNEITDPASGPPAAAPPGWIWGQPCPPNARWLNLVAGIQAFVTYLTISATQEQLALVSYNNNTTIDVPIAPTYAGINPALNVYTASFPMGSTATGDGILMGINALADPNARPWAAKIMIVMTDGLTNTGSDPIASATLAAAQNIQIFTITYAAEADQATMATVASIGDGSTYHATTPADLTTVFGTIASQLPSLLCK